ncbi:hypothetical protein BH09PLA1_BH09PLA1_01830 [soil metagenome]
MRDFRFVRIDVDRIPAYVRSLPIDRLNAPELDPKAHYIGEPADTVGFFVTLDAINFGSGYFPHLSKLPGRSGYVTVATHLADYFRAQGLIGAKELAEMDAARCGELFHQQSDDGPIDELIGHFAGALRDLGQMLLADFGGDFVRLVRSANKSAGTLVHTLARMPMFRDVQIYRNLEVPFFKRAQLTAADLNLALRGHELGEFDDLDQLTIFADNLVPHVLRCDAVLKYDESLAARIDAGELIAANSEEEVEIRAAAVHAAELIVAELHRAGQRVTAMQVDYLLWNRGQEPSYKARPRHRARTVYY